MKFFILLSLLLPLVGNAETPHNQVTTTLGGAPNIDFNWTPTFFDIGGNSERRIAAYGKQLECKMSSIKHDAELRVQKDMLPIWEAMREKEQQTKTTLKKLNEDFQKQLDLEEEDEKEGKPKINPQEKKKKQLQKYYESQKKDALRYIKSLKVSYAQSSKDLEAAIKSWDNKPNIQKREILKYIDHYDTLESELEEAKPSPFIDLARVSADTGLQFLTSAASVAGGEEGNFETSLGGSATSLEMARSLLDLSLGFTPGVSIGKDAYEAITGYGLLPNFETGKIEKLTHLERAFAVLGVASLGGTNLVKGSFKAIARIADAASTKLGNQLIRKGIEESVILAKDIGSSLSKIQIKTPYRYATQEFTSEALVARAKVQEGSRLYRAGTRGKSQTGKEAQFWSLEWPGSKNYGERYGIPKENLQKMDFIETAVIKEDSEFITRIAPPAKGSPGGGGIEVVVPEGGVRIESHKSL